MTVLTLAGSAYFASAYRADHAMPDLDPTTDAVVSERDALDKTGLLAVLGEDNVVWRDPVIGAAAVTASQRGEQ